jgi:hypothetical protein
MCERPLPSRVQPSPSRVLRRVALLARDPQRLLVTD